MCYRKTIKDYRCFNRTCQFLMENKDYDPKAPRHCDAGTKTYCVHPVMAPGHICSKVKNYE